MMTTTRHSATLYALPLLVLLSACSGGATGSSSGASSSSSSGASGNSSGSTVDSDAAVVTESGQEIAKELFKAPEPGFDPMDYYGLYQLLVSDQGFDPSPVRMRLEEGFVSIAHKSSGGDLVGVRVQVQMSGSKIVFLEGAKATVGSPCITHIVQIELKAGTGQLTPTGTTGTIAGTLPLEILGGACGQSQQSGSPLTPTGIYTQSVGFVKIGK